MNPKQIFLFLFIITSFSGFAGEREGGGGSIEHMRSRNKIVSLVDMMIADIKVLKEEHFPFLSIEQLEIARDVTTYEFTEKPLFVKIDGKKTLVDAINYPDEMRIVLNENRVSLAKKKDLKALLFHEILGLLEIDDTKYIHSRKYYNLLNKTSEGLRISELSVNLGRVYHNIYSHESSLNLMAINSLVSSITKNLEGFENYSTESHKFIRLYVKVPVDPSSLTLSKIESKSNFIFDPSSGFCKNFSDSEKHAPHELDTRIVVFKVLESLRDDMGLIKSFSIRSVADPDCADSDQAGAMLVETDYYIWNESNSVY